MVDLHAAGTTASRVKAARTHIAHRFLQEGPHRMVRISSEKSRGKKGEEERIESKRTEERTKCRPVWQRTRGSVKGLRCHFGTDSLELT